MIEEIQGDLFAISRPSSSSLAHCIAKDLGMGKGISGIFKKKYGGINELKAQNLDVGSCGVLKRNEGNDGENEIENKFIFCLITKNKSSGYPKISDLKASLKQMKLKAIENNVKMISMPKIGSGLDKLLWEDVKNVIVEVFDNSDIDIKIYYL